MNQNARNFYQISSEMAATGALDKLGYEIVSMGNWHHALQHEKQRWLNSIFTVPVIMKQIKKNYKAYYDQMKAAEMKKED